MVNNKFVCAILGVLIFTLIGLHLYRSSEYAACRDRGGIPVRTMYGPGVNCMEPKQ